MPPACSGADRGVAASRSSGTRSSRCSSPHFADGSGGATSRRSSSIPRSSPTSSTRRCGARRSRTSSPSASTSILPPAAELTPDCPGRPRGAVRDHRPGAARSGAARREGLARLFRELELPLIPRPRADGGDRRRAGPRGAAGCSRREFGTEISRLEEEIYADVGHEFNLGSPKQLGEVLFEELKLPKGKRTKTGYSTDASVLEELRTVHPMVEQAARLADLHEAPIDLRRGAAGPDGRRRATAHDVPPGGGGDGAPVVVRPEPPEHPDPDAARSADPARVRGRRAGTDAARGRLLADRAAHPRPRVGRRST